MLSDLHWSQLIKLLLQCELEIILNPYRSGLCISAHSQWGAPLLQATASTPRGDSGPATYPLEDTDQASGNWCWALRTEPAARKLRRIGDRASFSVFFLFKPFRSVQTIAGHGTQDGGEAMVLGKWTLARWTALTVRSSTEPHWDAPTQQKAATTLEGRGEGLLKSWPLSQEILWPCGRKGIIRKWSKTGIVMIGHHIK